MPKYKSTSEGFIYLSILDSFYNFYNITVEIFGFIFFYEVFDGNLLLTFMPQALMRIFIGLLTYYAAGLLGRIGTRLSLSISFILFIAGLLPLYLFYISGYIVYVLIWYMFYHLNKLFYFTPIIYLYGQMTKHKDRAHSFMIKNYMLIFVGFVAPFASGAITEEYGFIGLMLFVSVVMSSALLIVRKVPDMTFEFKRKDFEKVKHKVGGELALRSTQLYTFIRVSNILWIIYLAINVESASKIGLLISLSLGLSVLLNGLLGNVLDRFDRVKIFDGSIFAFGVLNVMRVSGIPVWFNELTYRVFSKVNAQSAEVVIYDDLNDGLSQDLKDESTVFFESAAELAIGVGLLLVGILSLYMSIESLFIILALSTFASMVYRRYIFNRS